MRKLTLDDYFRWFFELDAGQMSKSIRFFSFLGVTIFNIDVAQST